MRRVLPDARVAAVARRAAEVERATQRTWPGEVRWWQPRGTAYVPADRFGTHTVAQWTAEARRLLAAHAPDGPALCNLFALDTPDPDLLRARVEAMLATGAVPDVRIDFEDGYGDRSDEEEDRDAAAAGTAVAAAHSEGRLPPRYGVRPRSFADGLAGRCLRTLDVFLCALTDGTDGLLPPGLRITFPKVVDPEHVASLADVLSQLEGALGLDAGALVVEVQVETPMSIVDASGGHALRGIVAAGAGRVRAAHFGVFDYTAALGLPPREQRLDHPACDHARHALQAALAGTGVELSDGSSNVAPADDTTDEVARALRIHAAHVRHALEHGFVQGWDLHPAHLVSRAAAVAAFYLQDLDAVCARVRAWREPAGDASGVLDEPATVATLLRHLRRAVAADAVDAEEVVARTGLAGLADADVDVGALSRRS